MFDKDDFVKEVNRSGVHVGRVIRAFNGGVSVLDACTGKKTVFIHPETATQADYDAEVEQRLHPQKIDIDTPQPVKQVFPVSAKPKVYRWSCLECGAKYNGHACPQCDGEDRILNTDNDHDPSYVGGAGTERYTPGE